MLREGMEVVLSILIYSWLGNTVPVVTTLLIHPVVE